MRFAKVKSLSALASIERHSKERSRLKNRRHPELESKNIRIAPLPYTADMSYVDRFRERTKDISFRKDAVRALEFIFAYSPDADGTFDRQKWMNENINWAEETFGKNSIIAISGDWDESLFHNHLVLIPIYNNKLSAKHYINGKKQLSQLQDSYAEKMKQFGLERGRRFLDNPEIQSPRHRLLSDYWHELKKDVQKTKEKIFGDTSDVR